MPGEVYRALGDPVLDTNELLESLAIAKFDQDDVKYQSKHELNTVLVASTIRVSKPKVAIKANELIKTQLVKSNLRLKYVKHGSDFKRAVEREINPMGNDNQTAFLIDLDKRNYFQGLYHIHLGNQPSTSSNETTVTQKKTNAPKMSKAELEQKLGFKSTNDTEGSINAFEAVKQELQDKKDLENYLLTHKLSRMQIDRIPQFHRKEAAFVCANNLMFDFSEA